MSPGQIDGAVVRRHLIAIDEAVQELRRLREAAPSLDADRSKRWAVERGLQLCAQNSLDVATHLAASAGRDVPDYASAIDRLVDLGALPARFAARFRAVAGFRNVVVHGYLEIDPEILRQLLNERLEDFAEFAALVDRYLASAGR
jgi:uncharacterized protein YutE (UPF0331/DUF86 family)